MKILFIVIYITAIPIIAHTQNGNPDPSFGKNGIQTTGIKLNISSEIPKKIIPLQDGGFYLTIVVDQSTAIVKYLENGSIDSTYGEGGHSEIAHFSVIDAAIDNEKNIVVTGYSQGSNNSFFTARYLPDGTLDKSFGNNGIGYCTNLKADPSSVDIQGDKIIITGTRFSGFFGDYSDIVTVRYTHEGFLDMAFGNGGILITDFNENLIANAVVSQGEKLIVGGSIGTLGANSKSFFLVRYNIDGSLDQSFGSGGIQTTQFENNSIIADLVIQGEKVVATGSSNNQFAIARYNSDGSPDNSLSEDGKTTININTYSITSVAAVGIQGEKIVITGEASGFGIVTIRLNFDGSIDESFSGDGILYTNTSGYDYTSPGTLALQGNKVIIAGYVYAFNSGNSKADFVVARYNQDGSPDTGFSEDGSLVDFYPNSRINFTNTVMQKDGKLLVIGNAFTSIDRRRDDFIVVRYNLDGSLDKTFNGDGIQRTNFGYLSNDYAIAATMQDEKILVAGYCYDPSDNNNYNFAIARYNPDGTLDNSFGINGKVISDLGNHSNDMAKAMTIQEDKIIVAGYNYQDAIGISW